MRDFFGLFVPGMITGAELVMIFFYFRRPK